MLSIGGAVVAVRVRGRRDGDVRASRPSHRPPTRTRRSGAEWAKTPWHKNFKPEEIDPTDLKLAPLPPVVEEVGAQYWYLGRDGRVSNRQAGRMGSPLPSP